MVNPTWLTTREAAKIARVDDSYLRRLCGRGKLNARLRGNSWMIDPVSFKQWHQARMERIEREKQK